MDLVLDCNQIAILWWLQAQRWEGRESLIKITFFTVNCSDWEFHEILVFVLNLLVNFFYEHMHEQVLHHFEWIVDEQGKTIRVKNYCRTEWFLLIICCSIQLYWESGAYFMLISIIESTKQCSDILKLHTQCAIISIAGIIIGQGGQQSDALPR